MNINLGDVETTALIPVVIKANETLRKNPRVRDEVAVEMIKTLGIDTKPFDKFMSHEGVIARKEIADLCEGLRFVEEHSFNEEMKKHSFAGWLFAKLLPKINDRWAVFEW